MESTGVEALLIPNSRRFSLFPIKHARLWELGKQIRDSHWTVQEIDLSADLVDWNGKLTANERHFIGRVLGFFNSSDGVVNENLALNFQVEVQLPEARYFYSFQNQQESIHSEMYGMLIQTYISQEEEREKLFNAFETLPCVQKKAAWAMRWINDKEAPFSVRLIAFAVVEGIFFSGSFCAIYWLKKRNLMPGLCKSNEFISRDERLHCEHACELFSMLQKKPTQEVVHRIFKEAVDIEKEFVCDALPVALIGMNAKSMCEYIEYVADFWLVTLGYKKLYNARNPFDWMEPISLQVINNFFEHRTSEYAKASRGGTKTFSKNEDF